MLTAGPDGNPDGRRVHLGPVAHRCRGSARVCSSRRRASGRAPSRRRPGRSACGDRSGGTDPRRDPGPRLRRHSGGRGHPGVTSPSSGNWLSRSRNSVGLLGGRLAMAGAGERQLALPSWFRWRGWPSSTRPSGRGCLDQPSRCRHFQVSVTDTRGLLRRRSSPVWQVAEGPRSPRRIARSRCAGGGDRPWTSAADESPRPFGRCGLRPSHARRPRSTTSSATIASIASIASSRSPTGQRGQLAPRRCRPDRGVRLSEQLFEEDARLDGRFPVWVHALEYVERLLGRMQAGLLEQDLVVLVVLAEAHRHELHGGQVLR